MASHDELLNALNVINSVFGQSFDSHSLKQMMSLVRFYKEDKEMFHSMLAERDENCKGRTHLIKMIRGGNLTWAKRIVDMLDTIDSFTINSSEFMGKECYICYEPFEESHTVYRLPCGGHHIFHKHCIDKWVTINSTCPYCRDHICIQNSTGILNTKTETEKTALYYAVKGGDIDLIEKLLEKGALIQYNDADVLHLAAGFSHPELVRHFIGKGRDIEVKDMEGHTPLYYAASYANKETNQCLLDLSANLQFFFYHPDYDGRLDTTALHIACSEGNMRSVPFYISYFKEKGMSIDMPDSNNHTPLFLAIEHSHKRVVETLVDAGAELSTFHEHHPLFEAFYQHEHQEEGRDILAFLLDKVDSLFQMEKKEEYRLILSELLKKACQKNNPSMFLKLLTTYDLEIQAECFSVLAMPSYLTALEKTNNLHKILNNQQFFFWCVKYDNMKAVELYIEKGYDIHVKDKENNSAAHLVKSIEMATLLEDCNLDFNVVNAKGQTPLHIYFTGHEALRKETLSYLPLDSSNRYSLPSYDDEYEDDEEIPRPPIVRRTVTQVVRRVVPRRNQGEAPRRNIIRIPRSRIVHRGETSVAPPPLPTPSRFAPLETDNSEDEEVEDFEPVPVPKKKSTEHIIDFFISKGIDVNAKTLKGSTALQLATYKNSGFYIRLLVKHGANVNEVTPMKTAAHIAMINDYKEAIEELVLHGADVHAMYDDETMLHYAVHTGFKGLVKILMEKGVSLDVRNKRGETALGKAIARGNTSFLTFLLEQGVNVHTPVHTNTTLPQTPIGFASYRGYGGIVSQLLEKGADINQKEVSGLTPILVACEKKNHSVIEVLLSKNCSLDFLDYEVKESAEEEVEEAELEDDTTLPASVIEAFIDRTNFPPKAKSIRVFQKPLANLNAAATPFEAQQ